MKKVYATLILAVFALPLWSSDYNTVVVSLRDGTEVTIKMSKQLTLQFDDTNLNAKSETIDINIPKDKITNFTHTYMQDTNGIDTPEVNDVISFENNGVRIDNLPANSIITLYTLTGQLVREVLAEGECFLAFQDFKKGIYILKINSISYKINIK